MMLTLCVLQDSGPSEGAQSRAAGRALFHYCRLFVKREDFEWFSQSFNSPGPTVRTEMRDSADSQ